MDLPEINKPCFVVWACTSHEDYEKITPKYFGKETFVFDGPSGVERCANLAAVTRFEPVKTEAMLWREQQIEKIKTVAQRSITTDFSWQKVTEALVDAGCLFPRELTDAVARKLWRESLITIEDMTITDIERYARMINQYIRGELDL